MISKKDFSIRGMSVDAFDYMRVTLASEEQILQWSHGEVKKAETVNYRTHKPEKDGLFCAKIFGPQQDFECLCGKYKRKKYKGIICEKCGVEVTESKVRRERMGHIDLVSPVTHIWYLRGPGSKIALVLDLDQKDLERVVYFERYIVLDTGKAEGAIHKKDVLTEADLEELLKKFADTDFRVGMGAEAIQELLGQVNAEKEVEELRGSLKSENSLQKKLKLSKRLRALEAFLDSENRPEWMILKVLPVLPPDLRPLVKLESGSFASSDLNERYRRILNRNTRLRKLIDQNAPEIIVKNEKRMLQESVDALLENGAHGRQYLASNNRPLKSLSDSLKSKNGRFRQNLLGKRVDYSGRSVIVVNPNIKLHQCGLPRIMALELFKPFVIHLLEDKYNTSIAGAKEMIEEGAPEVWECLEEAVKHHPILLNRAPTLHRNSVQAFEPILVEGKALQIHPLICPAFNADFDGDQMAVHVPLSVEAQVEARELILAPLNILSPASGKPLAVPTQDMVLGAYYLTLKRDGRKGEGKTFASMEDVKIAYDLGFVEIHAKILLRWKGEVKNIESYMDDSQDVLACPPKKPEKDIIETTVGRVIFNMHLPAGIPFINGLLKKRGMERLAYFAYQTVGSEKTVAMLDELKALGFEFATKAGFSIATADMIVPPEKAQIIKAAEEKVSGFNDQFNNGIISQEERRNQITETWEKVTNDITKRMRKNIEEEMKKTGELNSLLIMSESGARGKMDQVRQLAGIRGLMAKPSGEVLETPIKSNFREGLTSLEYFISTHGARKGSADTALKTAEAGYLTRRLVDSAQDVVITEEDCGSPLYTELSALIENGQVIESFYDRIVGRTAMEKIEDQESGEVIVEYNEEIDEAAAKKIVDLGYSTIKVRSVLTCQTEEGLCRKCYGRDLSRGKVVDIGEAVGIIAAQSIGEPGTQLTMRTFHIGGIASGLTATSKLKAQNEGTVRFNGIKYVEDKDGYNVVTNRTGTISVLDFKGREKEIYPMVYGATLVVKDGQKVKRGDGLTEWDPYSMVIVTEVGGTVNYRDFKDAVTCIKDIDEQTNRIKTRIIKSKDDKMQPALEIREGKKILREYYLPSDAILNVEDGVPVTPGQILAKIPRETAKTKDITGGLPRAQDLFEARKPQNPAVISEIDGKVKFGSLTKGLRKIIIEPDDGGKAEEYSVSTSNYLRVQEGDRVKAGEALIEAPSDPHKILDALGETEIAKYLLKEVQSVYRGQGVEINDKHIEVIVRQMLKWIKIEEVGDSKFFYGQIVSKFDFNKENRRIAETMEDGHQATGSPCLLGISKAALNTDSFISAAAFQQTTRVLTDAAFYGKTDYLKGIKENVTMGRLIPAGTGFKAYKPYEVMEKHPHEESTKEGA